MQNNWQDIAQFILGAWITISPFVLGFITLGSPPAATAILIGVFVTTVGVTVMSNPDYWGEWTNLGLGALLLVSPWLFGYADATIAMINAVASGLVVVILAVLGVQRLKQVQAT